jgi:hypothetical protein
VAYVNATQHIAAGSGTYDVYDKNAYRMGSNLDPGASTTNTVGTSADPFAIIYATSYYLNGVVETLTPTTAFSADYTIVTSLGSGSTTAIPTTSAVVSALTVTKTSFTLTAASGVSLSLTGYLYSDKWVHIYGKATVSSALYGGGNIFSVPSTAYAPSEDTFFVAYAPFQPSGEAYPYPSSGIALGYASLSFNNFSTTTVPASAAIYVDIYYRVS